MTSAFDDRALAFACEGEHLVGVVSHPRRPGTRGVLIVVGGPQYRAGSHRQFVLLARALASRGHAVMRFDTRGMGDGSGEFPGFEHLDADLRCAIDRFFAEIPELQEVVLWGLCDAASAVLFYGYQDRRVAGLVVVNPWVRTVAGEAQAYLRHYYLQRLKDPRFWRGALQGRLRVVESLRGIVTQVRRALRGADTGKRTGSPAPDRSASLPERMAAGLQRFRGKVLLVLSGDDLTAKEFGDVVSASGQWAGLLSEARVTRRDLPDANHTFSSRVWRERVADWTHAWMQSW